MSKEKSSATASGIGFTGLLAIVFIVLKLFKVTEVAEWSWLWVLSPLWLPAALLIAFFIIVAIIVSRK